MNTTPKSPGVVELPYNAGKIVEVRNVVEGPVSTVDFGTITVTENWDRLFIWNGTAQIVVLQSAYPALRYVIGFFIDPATRAPDAIRAAALDEAAKVADDMWGEGPDGHYDNGATSDGFNIATQRIAAAIRALITTPKEPTT